jgi:hypothetical protein
VDLLNINKLLAAKDQTIQIQSELISHLQIQIDDLVKALSRLVPEPIKLKPFDEEANRPLTFDESENKFRPMRDEEIQRDIRGLQELGIV